MKEDFAAIIQARIDDLLLLESKASRRSTEFEVNINEFYQQSKEALAGLRKSEEAIESRVLSLKQQVIDVAKHAEKCSKSLRYAAYIFLGSILFILLIVGGAVFWYSGVKDDLASAKEELGYLNAKIKRTPTIEYVQGDDFVRVEPGTETSLSRANGKSLPGRYAKLWCSKKK